MSQNSSVKEALRQHYLEKNLSNAQIGTLTTLLQSSQPGGAKRNFKSWKSVLLVVAAALVLVVVRFSGESSSNVFEEISYNHAKDLRIEFSVASFEELNGYMTKLDFTVRSPLRAAREGWRMIGARYCKVQGNIAAQIKVSINGSKELSTLYVSRLPAGLELENTQSKVLDGHKISIWQENGLFYGLAGPLDSI